LASLAYTAAIVGLFGASIHLKGLPTSAVPSSCDEPARPIDLLPIAHSTISGLETLAFAFSSCPEKLLNVDVHSLFPIDPSTTTHHVPPQRRHVIVDLPPRPPLLPYAKPSSAGPETKTIQRSGDCSSCTLDLEVYGGCLRRNLTARNSPSIIGLV